MLRHLLAVAYVVWGWAACVRVCAAFHYQLPGRVGVRLRTVVAVRATTGPSLPDFMSWLKPILSPAPQKDTKSARSRAEETKKQLIRRVARLDRGFVANSTDRAEVMQLVRTLEALNPISEPIKAPEISCTWSVLYTAPVNETDARAKLNYVYGPVAAVVRDLIPKGLITSRGIFQSIDAPAGRVQNVAEFTLLGKWQGAVVVGGDAAPVPPRRLNVTFTDGYVELEELRFDFSLKAISPKGWVDITYLDDSLRLTRGDKGTLFVVARVPPPTTNKTRQNK